MSCFVLQVWFLSLPLIFGVDGHHGTFGVRLGFFCVELFRKCAIFFFFFCFFTSSGRWVFESDWKMIDIFFQL